MATGEETAKDSRQRPGGKPLGGSAEQTAGMGPRLGRAGRENDDESLRRTGFCPPSSSNWCSSG